MLTQNSLSQKLPDTCPTSQTDGLSQLSIVNNSLIPWGRLNFIKPNMKSFEIVKNSIVVGRSPSCDLMLDKEEVGEKIVGYLSKEHFKLKREFVSDNDFSVHIVDVSSNGTFVNGKKLSKGDTAVLENGDEIALAFPKFKVFRYESGNTDSTLNWISKEVRDRYAVSRILGTGACGVVRLVFEKSSRKALAMKIIQKKRFNFNDESSRLQREANVLRALSHACIIRFENVIDSSEHMYIITEFVEGGELFDRVKRGITESQAKFYFYQLVLAVQYLHNKQIIHRDIKLENVLLSSHEPESLIKLSDFGYSKFIDPESVMNTICGTPLYIAPEILKSKGKLGTYDKRIDIWSMGVALYICLSATVPFLSGRKDKSLTEQILEGLYYFPKAYWKGITLKGQDLVRKMMTVNQNERITVEEILKHGWLQDRAMKIKVNRLLNAPLLKEDAKDEENANAKRRKLDSSA